MELQTIRQVSLDYGVSARMLRYYEQIGLLESRRVDDYAYRVYDENAVKKLQQIIILRKLQIPMKQIKDILNNQNAVEVIEIFKQSINELDEQITALSTVKSILAHFITELQEKADVNLKLDLLNDKTMLAAVNALSFSENKIKEKISIEELNKASETLSKKNQLKIFTFKTQLDEFLFLGFEQVVTSNSDFGIVWDNFFKMSEKVLDNKGRWRSHTIAFRISPEENDNLNRRVKLSGLTKQDYIIRRIQCRDVVVQSNPRVYKALRNQLAAVFEELQCIQSGGQIDGDLLEIIKLIAVTMNGLKEESE